MKTCLLNFRADFVPLVESGAKPHTIRARRLDNRDPLPGDILHLYAGLRTKGCRLLRAEACEYVREITIQQSAGDVHHVLLGGDEMSQDGIEVLALNDGFPNAAEFVRFFSKTYGLPFTGLLIGWTPTISHVTRH